MSSHAPLSHEQLWLKIAAAACRLIPLDEIDRLVAEHKPEFVPVPGRESEGPKPPAEETSGVVQRRLSNGVALNYKVRFF